MFLKSYYARLYNIFTNKSITKLRFRDKTDETIVEAITKLRSWYVYDYINGYKGVTPMAREIFQDVCSVGFGIVMKTWDIKQRKTFELVKNELLEEMGDLGAQAEGLKEGDKLDISEYKEVAKIVTVFEGTRLFTVPFEDAFFPNLIPGSNDLNYPPCVIITARGVENDLKIKAEQELYDSATIEKVIDSERQKSSSGYAREQSVKDIRDSLTGYESYASTYDDEEVNIDYCFCTYDIDDDGFAEEIVVTRMSDGKILNVNYLDRVSKLGNRPIIKFDCFTKSRQAYSRGVPEYMYQLQEALDMNHNLRMNSLQMQTMPWGVYSATSSLDKEMKKVGPGYWIQVDDVNNSMRPMSFPVNAAALGIEEDKYFQYAERLATVPPHASGMVGDNVGPLRSTSGLTALLKQVNKEFKPMVDINAESWKSLELSLLEDLEFRVDTQLKMRVLGPTLKDAMAPFEFRDAFRLTAMLDMSIEVASLIESEEFRRNDASVLYSLFTTPGLLQQYGIVTPEGIYNFAKDVLSEYGRDYSAYLEKPEFAKKLLTVWEEVQYIAQLEIPPMSPMDDHARKVEELNQFMESPEFKEAFDGGVYTHQTVDVFNQTIKKHEELAKMSQAQGFNPTGANAVLGADLNAQQAGVAPPARRPKSKLNYSWASIPTAKYYTTRWA